ncbi:MAG: hypothetical protein U5L45_25030 [Saprospiraceae bacterium]|nr:hypothetical protein [Saprospiraceae bacterium]
MIFVIYIVTRSLRSHGEENVVHFSSLPENEPPLLFCASEASVAK